jgi:hypothetical protein
MDQFIDLPPFPVLKTVVAELTSFLPAPSGQPTSCQAHPPAAMTARAALFFPEQLLAALVLGAASGVIEADFPLVLEPPDRRGPA